MTISDHIAPGEIFERRFRIVRVLGTGGFGTVYLAEHVELGNRVAIKLLHAPTSDSRFVREAKVLSQLESPNVVRFVDFGRDSLGRPYMISEFAEGVPLDELVARNGPQPAARVASLLADILTGLAEAHRHGIVHRDVKPSNIIVTPSGTAKVLDFGIAGVAQHDDSPHERLTATGSFVGTPRYAAPESLFAGSSSSPRADLFAVGLIGYELLTGAPAIASAEIESIVRRHSSGTGIELPPGADVGESLRGFVDNLLERDPRDRPADAADALARLRALAVEIGSTTEEETRTAPEWLEATPYTRTGASPTKIEETPRFRAAVSDSREVEPHPSNRPESGSRRRVVLPIVVTVVASVGAVAAYSIHARPVASAPPPLQERRQFDALDPDTVLHALDPERGLREVRGTVRLSAVEACTLMVSSRSNPLPDDRIYFVGSTIARDQRIEGRLISSESYARYASECFRASFVARSVVETAELAAAKEALSPDAQRSRGVKVSGADEADQATKVITNFLKRNGL